MKSPQDFKKIFIHRDSVDMRKAINGLSGIVESCSFGSLMEPHLFVFTGRRRDVVKILYFDRGGFCLWQKRLELEKFPWPKKATDSVLTVTPEQLSWLLEGYDIWKMKPFTALHFEKVG